MGFHRHARANIPIHENNNMNTMWRLLLSRAILCLSLLSLLYLPAVSAESLSDIDKEIQADSNLRIDRGGLDAYNIYQGVTTSRLDRKIKILQAAGIHPRFYQTSDGLRDYTTVNTGEVAPINTTTGEH